MFQVSVKHTNITLICECWCHLISVTR